MDLSPLLLYASLVVAVAGGIGMLVLRQPVHSAVSLLLTMLALALAYAMLQAHLLAALQLIIYAGAIMILIVYVIMLLDAGSDDDRRTWRRGGFLAIPVLLVLFVGGGSRLMSTPAQGPAALALHDRRAGPEGLCVDHRDGDGDGLTDCADSDCSRHEACFGSVRSVGAALLGPYVLPFEVSSVLLLGGIVGALLLTVRRPAAAAAARTDAEASAEDHVDAA